jgi:HSP20 family protein
MTRKDIMKRPNSQHAVPSERSYYERRIVPPADIIENDNEYIVRVDVPGVDKKSITLKVEGDTLRVQGSTGEHHRENKTLLINEITPTTYKREFHLGKDVDRTRINGEYDAGVLTITLGKNEHSKPRDIKIK